MPIYISLDYGDWIGHGDLIKSKHCRMLYIFVNYTSILNTFYYCFYN